MQNPGRPSGVAWGASQSSVAGYGYFVGACDIVIIVQRASAAANWEKYQCS